LPTRDSAKVVSRVNGRRNRIGPRVRLLAVVTAIMLLAVSVQLFRITALASGNYRGLGTSESEVKITLPGLRGKIIARNGQVLAMSLVRDQIIADPYQIDHKTAEAKTLAAILGIAVQNVEAAFDKPGGYAVVDSSVPLNIGNRVDKLVTSYALPGITVEPTEQRFYPIGPTAEPVIGRVDASGKGAFGLEYQYQKELNGKDGYEVVKVAANGDPVPGPKVAYVAPQPGANLVVSLDPVLQYYVEQALAAQMIKTRAIGGTAIVMDVQTGQLLAMASLSAPPLPGSPFASSVNQPVDVPRAKPVESWINQAVGYSYEPGSVAKIATFAAALEDGLITPSSTEVVPNDLVIDGSVFHDAESHPTEVLTMKQILARSSNVGTIEIARKLGPSRLVASFERLGWGEPTGLGFPGETYGYIKPPTLWSPTAIGSTPIGQDQLVTPLQILDSYNAVADGGLMVTPRLVLGFVRDGRFQKYAVPAPKRVMPAWVASDLKSLLSGVTGSNATAPAARVPGYLIAGKTGTSHKPYHNRIGYQPGAYWGTFVGMIPAPHPVLTAIVMLDQPVPIYGGMAAAPVFSQIMRYAVQRYGITPSGKVEGNLLPVVKAPSKAVPKHHLKAKASIRGASK
jgi:cell division protein FtsI (penicillin-binding protein 3)